jgi:hypothetical protein
MVDLELLRSLVRKLIGKSKSKNNFGLYVSAE